MINAKAPPPSVLRPFPGSSSRPSFTSEYVATSALLQDSYGNRGHSLSDAPPLTMPMPHGQAPQSVWSCCVPWVSGAFLRMPTDVCGEDAQLLFVT
jgi:hypothetical protein